LKAIQINGYSKSINTILRDLPIPEIGDTEVLLQVKAAAVNPLDILILTGGVKLIQDYSMPLTLGNECSGIVAAVGKNVTGFSKGDAVYARLPIERIGAFAEYVAVDGTAIASIPEQYDLANAAAIPLTGLTAYQGITEELAAEPGATVFIPGGSGSFGQMAVPIAKALGLHVITSGNEKSREYIMDAGADQYLDYRKENYWEKLSNIDYVIDTLGAMEFDHELSILKKGGRLLSLKTGPNKQFAISHGLPFWKKGLFSMAGAKYDKKAEQEGKTYRFMFVRSNGTQLQKITRIVEQYHIVPRIDPHPFTIEQASEALNLIAHGHTEGKVIIHF
jgi:NADPH:quinone reductase-like Zn-dependent oxidoreductase